MCNEEMDFYLYFCHLIIARNILCAPLLLRLLYAHSSLRTSTGCLAALRKRGVTEDKAGKRQEGYGGEELRILRIRSYLSARFLPIFLCLAEARALNGYENYYTRRAGAFPVAIIYRHPLDKVLVFEVQWKFESFCWKRGRRNNVCVLEDNVSESMASRFRKPVIIGPT